MNFRYMIYFLILFIFSLFTLHFTIEIENMYEIQFTFIEKSVYIIISLIFAFISIFTMIITRNITNDYGRFLLAKTKVALKFNLYIIQVLVFLLWTFTFSFILKITQEIYLFDNELFFSIKLLFSFLYGIVIILFLNGLTLFKGKK